MSNNRDRTSFLHFGFVFFTWFFGKTREKSYSGIPPIAIARESYPAVFAYRVLRYTSSTVKRERTV